MTFDDFSGHSFDLEPVEVKKNFSYKLYYKVVMKNWKTTLFGFLAIAAKFAESQGYIPVGLGDWLVSVFTGLGLAAAGDAKNQTTTK